MVKGQILGGGGLKGGRFEKGGGGGSIPVERERSQCKLIKAGGRAWGCFQAS